VSSGLLGEITEEHFDKLFNINVKETLFTVHKALPLLNDGASIILTGPVGSIKSTPGFCVNSYDDRLIVV
jgi:NAD(P)-dependent dehydrogenase (short-subunit alcohol dehydrogenase family)